MNEKIITAVVVTYNRKDLLEESLNALLDIKKYKLNICVIDNNSNDGTDELIKTKFADKKSVFYEKQQQNIGGAGGFNHGIKSALKLNSDYIWLMDDDCIVNEKALDVLVNKAISLNDNFGFLSSNVKWIDGNQCLMNNQKISMTKKMTDFNKDQRIDEATFVSLFLNAIAVEKVGLPVKEFFIWGDDIEYTYRISRLYNCYFVTDSVVLHKCKNNVGSNIVKDNERLDRYFYAYRNEGYMYKRAGLKGKLYYFLKILYHKFKVRGELKKEKIAVINKGKNASKTFNPKIEYAYRPNTKVNVAEFFAEPLSYGGQEAFILNMYRHFNNDNRYTFITPFNADNKEIMSLADKRGDRVLYFNYKFHSIFRKRAVSKVIKKVVKENDFDVIHVHSGSIFSLLHAAKCAKKAGVKNVIVHSHSTGNNNLKYKVIKWISDRSINKYVDVYLACSHLAASWKFPKEIIDNKQYIVIKNGIELDKYKFNKDIREKIRKELGVKDDEYVLLNVGRLSEQKNQKYLLKIAKKIDSFKFKVLIVGDGEFEEELKNEIANYKLEDRVTLVGRRTDIYNVFMAGDMFLFPSIFEGLGIVLVEAQASGLYSICSNTIPEDVFLTDIVKPLPIENGDVNLWVKEILENKDKKIDRERYAEEVKKTGYSAELSAKELENIYRN